MLRAWEPGEIFSNKDAVMRIPDQSKAVLVVGMHRSGTSVLTRCLNLLGLPLGSSEELMPAVPNENPTGFWENQYLSDFNEKILAAWDGSWAVPPVLSEGWWQDARLSQLNEQAKAILERTFQAPYWVWKDPRNCLTLPFWRQHLTAPPVIVFVFRNPLEVAKSLQKRNHFSKETSMALWEIYSQAALNRIDSLPVYAISYDDLLARPKSGLERMMRFLEHQGLAGLRMPSEELIDAFISHPLQHWNIADEDFFEDPEIKPEQKELHRAVMQLPEQSGCFRSPELEKVSLQESYSLLHHRREQQIFLSSYRGYLVHAAAAHTSAVDIVIPVYGQAGLVQQCVDSVLHTTEDAHLILVNDCSPGEEILHLFRKWEGHPRLTLTQTPTNVGFIGACNQGVALGTAPFILFLNSDTQPLRPGWLKEMIPVEDDVAIVGAKLLYPPNISGPLAGTVQHAGVARNNDGFPYHPFLGRPADSPGANLVREVNAVTGGCFLIRRKVWNELGGWDCRFGRGVFEDVDLCWQARSRGYRVIYQPAACLYHYESASKAGNGIHSLHQHSNENLQKLLEKWQPLSSDEAIFFGKKTLERWQNSRTKIKQVQWLLGQHKLALALGELRKAVMIAEDLPEATAAYAQLLALVGNHLDSAAYLRKTIQHAPANWDARLLLVSELLQAGRPDEAAQELSVLKDVISEHATVRKLEKEINRCSHKKEVVYPEQAVFSSQSFSDQAINTLEQLLSSEDILSVLQEYEDRLDDDLLRLVQSNVKAANTDGEVELAAGLEDLADYIKQIIYKRQGIAIPRQS